ncbi:putative multidrug ABC transporter permease YbhR [Dyadobacter sp. CECT 9275]|uniref:Multidrug ABC transporter permease YbhR n=1 Tax=Dyadobacter helix TaxID=2822344 RepID=A0A916NAY0_9BACT|nr:ABC transporter permease [Dyadobacter sp. CECT 9275]CAG4993508.1 putative multidrug ABC transporter permease YbhR [Dyadobacter sp. CECT 9275]
MRTILFLLEKEFRQVFRNKAMLPMLFAMPLIQLLLLPLAADYEVKNINIAVADHDHSTYSQKLVSKVIASGYFRLVGFTGSFQEAAQLVETDAADIILEIPAGFERNLVRENAQKLFIAVNAINGTKANVGGAYLTRIIADFNSDVNVEWLNPQRFNPQPVIEVTSSNWFNPHMNYNFFMVPGILAILVTMIGGYMAALNIVKEKEIGTIEQINVTPIRKHHFILGKLIPFWVMGMFIFSFGLFVIARMVYHIIPEGSILLLYTFLALYLFAILGFGLLVSTYCDTQQQAMSVAFFFVMIFLLMSGLFTSIDSMPAWAKVIAYLNPVTYFIDVMRSVVLKGSGFAELKFHFLKIIAFAIVLNSWAVLNYRKSS